MKHALEVLEYPSVLERLANHCETELGAALALDLQPSVEPAEVWSRLDLTAEAYRLLGEQSPPTLGSIRDVRRTVALAAKGAILGGQELYHVARCLEGMRAFRQFISTRRDKYVRLWVYGENLVDAKTVEQRLLDSLDMDGDVRDSASPELAKIRSRRAVASQRIVEKIQTYTVRYREYLSDPIYTTRDGRYVVPLKTEYRGKIRGIVHDTSSSGQTVFVEPEEVLQLGNTLRELEGAEREEVQRVLAKLSASVGTLALDIEAGVEAASELDLLLSAARMAYEEGGVQPEKSSGYGIDVSEGRHPLLDRASVVPLNLRIGFEEDGLLITGPNTGGKTVAIKTVGLLALMAQSGLFPPARALRLAPFSQVWADIGDEQSIQQSLSTFSGHIRNIADALKGLKPGGLVLFDELGAGTDPAEGAALAKSILLTIQSAGAKVVASTHYGELKAFAYNTPGFHNAAMEFDAKSLRPTYRLILGAPGASHALKIAERYGLPKDVVEGARNALTEEQQDVALMLEKLEQAQRQARIAQGEADKRAAELRKIESNSARKLAEADEVRRTVYAKAGEAIDTALREIRLQAADIFETLKKSADPRKLDEARANLKALQEAGQELAGRFQTDDRPKKADQEIRPGVNVKIEGYTQVGTVLGEPRNGSVQVQMGPLKLNVPTSKLTVVTTRVDDRKPRSNISLNRAMTTATEIHLRHMRAEDAQLTLERFLDDAVLGGLDQVRIVHGKGEGILRKLTQEVLRKHPHVRRWRDGEPAEGGQGATVVEFK